MIVEKRGNLNGPQNRSIVRKWVPSSWVPGRSSWRTVFYGGEGDFGLLGLGLSSAHEYEAVIHALRSWVSLAISGNISSEA